MSTWLVIGGTGHTGGRIVRGLQGRHRVVSTGSRDLDLAKPDQIRALLADTRPDVVLIPGGITNVDRCETDPVTARAVNAEGPGLVAAESGAYVLYISTDYVFDGEGGPYPEAAEPNPICRYGESKLEGERRVLRAGPHTAVVRTCGVFGWHPGGRNFLMQVHDRLASGGVQKAFEDQFLTPTYAQTLADAVIELAEERRTGLFHVGGAEFISRVEFCWALCEAFGFDAGRIEPVPTAAVPLPARRPLRAGLAMHRTSLRTPMLPLREALEQVLAERR